MSDADDQMGGHGGATGKDPADQNDDVPDKTKGNMHPGETGSDPKTAVGDVDTDEG
jgi:hypothetical protein